MSIDEAMAREMNWPEVEVPPEQRLLMDAAQPWIASNKILPLIFALADRMDVDAFAKSVAVHNSPEISIAVCTGVATDLERLCAEFPWDYETDDELDEVFDALLDMPWPTDAEFRGLQWVTDEVLNQVTAKSDQVIAKWNKAASNMA